MNKDNKKEMRLMTALSDIPDDMIASAVSEKPKKVWYRNFAVLGSVAACICVAAVGGVLLAMNKQDGYPIKYIYMDADDVKTEENVAYVPKWDERTIEEQYTELDFLGDIYISRGTQAKPELIGEKITSATAKGYDFYTDKTYAAQVDIYKISQVSDKFAVAVKFADSDKYYTYGKNLYTPDSLNALIEDMNLKENLSFSGKITCKNWKDDGKTSDDITFEGEVSEAVWNILLSDADVPITLMDADKDTKYTMNRGKTMHIGISVNLFGYNNIVMSVDEKGYLTTNILSTGKYFKIGEEKAAEFISYVENNLEGYIIKYVYEEEKNEKPEPENAVENSTTQTFVSKTEVKPTEDTSRPPYDEGPQTTGPDKVGVGYDTSEEDKPGIID